METSARRRDNVDDSFGNRADFNHRASGAKPAAGHYRLGMVCGVVLLILACSCPASALFRPGKKTSTEAPSATSFSLDGRRLTPTLVTRSTAPAPLGPQPDKTTPQAPSRTRQPAEENEARDRLREVLPGRDAEGDQVMPSAPIGEDNPLLNLFPELQRAPAPVWLRQGSRVTYWGQSANVAHIRDDKTTGGAGYIQYDLVAVEDGLVVSSLKMYLETSSGVLVPITVVASLGVPGAGDYWVSPGFLEGAERLANEELVVMHMPTEIAGQTYRAVRFEYHPPEAEYVWMFEEDSGLLLFYRHAIGEETDAHQQLADVTFVQQRDLTLPWQLYPAPDWVATGSYLRYDGVSTVMPGTMNETIIPYAVSINVGQIHPGWIEYEMSDYVAGQTNSSITRVTGPPVIFDAPWLAPEALDNLSDGQVLDYDPVTGATITASRHPDGLVTLFETGQAFQTNMAYDKDGVLVSMQQETHAGSVPIQIEISLSERR